MVNNYIKSLVRKYYTENKKFSQYFNGIFIVIQNKILIFSCIEICLTKFVAFIKRALNVFNIIMKKLFTFNAKQLFFIKVTIVRIKLLETVLINRQNCRE